MLRSTSPYAIATMLLALVVVPDVSAEEDPGLGLEQIVVTAQRRDESLQTVPIAINALSRNQLEAQGVRAMSDISKAVPGLVMETLNGQGQPYIRGIGSFVTNLSQEPAVGFYIDGIYLAGTTTMIGDLLDIERVEVLKGPQGTLFGRNTTGGAINMVTRTPSTETVAELDMSYGTWDTRNARAYVSGGSDTLAASLSAVYAHHRGYMRNLATGDRLNDQDRFGFRGKVLWNVNDDWSVTASAFYNHTDDFSSAGWNFINDNSLALDFGGKISTDPHRTYNDAVDLIKRKTTDYGGSAIVRGDLGDVQLVSLSSFTKVSVESGVDNDGSDLPLSGLGADLRLRHAFSQELQLLSNTDSALEWIVGAFYYNATGGVIPEPGVRVFSDILPPSAVYITGEQATRSYAVYGQATYNLTDQFAIIAGARYNHDKKILTRRKTVIPDFGILYDEPRDPRSWNDFSPKLTLTYKPTDQHMFYATFSRGFRAGSHNVNAAFTTAVNPEKINAWEVGGKHDLASNLRFNWSAFYYKYKNLQVDILIPETNVVGQENAASSENYGLDMDLTAVLTDNFQVVAGLSLLSAKYTDYQNAAIFFPNPAGLGNVGGTMDAKGNYVSHAPKVVISLAPTYRVPLDTGDVVLTGSLLYNDGYFYDPNNRIRQEPYVLLSSRITYNHEGDKWSIYAFANNILDEDVRQGALISEFGDKTQYGDPRVIGLGFTFKL